MDTHLEHHGHGGRVEDFRLITGAGKYASDWNAPGQLYGYFLRADRAHAQIVSIDTTRARAHPGVRHILTGEDAVREELLPKNVAKLVDEGRLKPLIDAERFTLEEVGKGHAKLESGRALGKLVIDIAAD